MSRRVCIRIPTPLRPLAGGLDSVEAEPGPIGEVLQELGRRHASLAARLFDDRGAVRSFVNVFLNDEDIRYLDGLGTAAVGGDVVALVPAVAGGLIAHGPIWEGSPSC